MQASVNTEATLLHRVWVDKKTFL